MRESLLIISLLFLTSEGCAFLPSMTPVTESRTEKEVREGFEEALTLLRKNSFQEASARYLSLAATYPGHRLAEEAHIIGETLKKIAEVEAEGARLRSHLIKLEGQLSALEDLKRENLELKTRIEHLNNSLKDLSRIEEGISKERGPVIKDKR